MIDSMRQRCLLGVTLLGLLGATVPAGAAPGEVNIPFERTEERASCADYVPNRKPHFGELHLHTKYSTDAYLYSVLAGPRDAYAFAKGESIGLAPYDENGTPSRSLQLRRPLDFAAVTDHSEGFGFMYHCLNPDSAGYNSAECLMVRREIPTPAFVPLAVLVSAAVGLPMPVRPPMCSTPGVDCEEGIGSIWQDMQAAAEEHYDRSEACEFTTFVAYEWSSSPLGNNIHRNVVFRNHVVPGRPTSTYDTDGPYAERLWAALQDQCLNSNTGCDAIAIPHNSNLGGGQMFPDPASPEQAATRAALEPIVEMFQHKGSSECRFDRTLGSGIDTNDEQCAFEQLSNYNLFADRFPGFGVNYLPPQALDRRNYVRNVLKDGLALEQEMGVNPFKFGLIGSTDSHNATAGATDEVGFAGHVGTADADPAARVSFRPTTGNIDWSPGGLAVVWAEENSRDSIFEGMRRREAYATSGTRPIVRFFGGWDYPEDLCDVPTDAGEAGRPGPAPQAADRASRRGGERASGEAAGPASGQQPAPPLDMISIAYRDGVPMGSDLPATSAAGAGTAPRFLVSALMDAGTEDLPGTPLQRIQIIKGWTDADGEVHEQVFDIAGDADNGASVDPESCTPLVEPARRTAELCQVWSDPEFDAAKPAFYYARVLENPSCRWSTYDCKALGVDPFDASCHQQALARPQDNLSACCNVEPTIQERAWTSPIWYTP